MRPSARDPPPDHHGSCTDYVGVDRISFPDVAGDHISITEASLGRCGGPGNALRAGNQDHSQDFIPSSLSPPAGPDSRRESPCNTDCAPPGPIQEHNSLDAGTLGDERREEKFTPIDAFNTDPKNGIGPESIGSLPGACQPGARSTSGPAGGCDPTSRCRTTRRSQAHRQRLMRRAC